MLRDLVLDGQGTHDAPLLLPKQARTHLRLLHTAGCTPPSERVRAFASLRASARVLPTDQYIRDVAGLRDPGVDGMMGGKRKRKSKSVSKRKGRKGTKGRKGKGRKQRGGGAVYNPMPASTSAPGLLLSPGDEAKAVRGMNPEWYLAEDAKSFAPKM